METEICRKITDFGKIGQRTLVYSLTENERPKKKRKPLEAAYGAAIHILESGEMTSVDGITDDREQAMRLVDILASNFVTPVSLKEIVRDWLIENAR